MLCAFGFQQIGVLLSDVYVDDPRPSHGQLGAEHGVRLELRVLERDELKGSQYSAQPISVGQPIWRVDLLETVAGEPGSFDRTHHHPAFTGWEPGRRVFVRELSADPIAWLASKLSDLPEVLKEAGLSADVAGPDDAEELRRAVPDILDTTERMLGRVHSGELGRPRPAIPAATYGPAGFSRSRPQLRGCRSAAYTARKMTPRSGDLLRDPGGDVPAATIPSHDTTEATRSCPRCAAVSPGRPPRAGWFPWPGSLPGPRREP